MKDLGNVEQTDNVAILVADRLVVSGYSLARSSTYQMPKVLGDH